MPVILPTLSPLRNINVSALLTASQIEASAEKNSEFSNLLV